jgi:hypothetical protein
MIETPRDEGLSINVTNIHLINGTQTTFLYSVTSVPASGIICVGQLQLSTVYNVCLSTSNMPERAVCRQRSTTAAEGSSMEGCLRPDSRETTTVKVETADNGSRETTTVKVETAGNGKANYTTE